MYLIKSTAVDSSHYWSKSYSCRNVIGHIWPSNTRGSFKKFEVLKENPNKQWDEKEKEIKEKKWASTQKKEEKKRNKDKECIETKDL